MANTYTPNPVDTSDIELPEELQALVEIMAKNVHEVWARERQKEGWTYGPVKDSNKKTNPTLVPYEELPDSEKAYDRNTATETLKLLQKKGVKFRIPYSLEKEIQEMKAQEWENSLTESERREIQERKRWNCEREEQDVEDFVQSGKKYAILQTKKITYPNPDRDFFQNTVCYKADTLKKACQVALRWKENERNGKENRYIDDPERFPLPTTEEHIHSDYDYEICAIDNDEFYRNFEPVANVGGNVFAEENLIYEEKPHIRNYDNKSKLWENQKTYQECFQELQQLKKEQPEWFEGKIKSYDKEEFPQVVFQNMNHLQDRYGLYTQSGEKLAQSDSACEINLNLYYFITPPKNEFDKDVFQGWAKKDGKEETLYVRERKDGAEPQTIAKATATYTKDGQLTSAHYFSTPEFDKAMAEDRKVPMYLFCDESQRGEYEDPRDAQEMFETAYNEEKETEPDWDYSSMYEVGDRDYKDYTCGIIQTTRGEYYSSEYEDKLSQAFVDDKITDSLNFVELGSITHVVTMTDRGTSASGQTYDTYDPGSPAEFDSEIENESYWIDSKFQQQLDDLNLQEQVAKAENRGNQEAVFTDLESEKGTVVSKEGYQEQQVEPDEDDDLDVDVNLKGGRV